jgi:purine-nucleoside phosphorylase
MLDVDEMLKSCEAAKRLLPPVEPVCTLVLGSGWSSVVDSFEVLARVGYDRIPCLRGRGVAGHPGNLAAFRFAGREFLAFNGRRHTYEGLGWEPVVFPAFFARSSGCEALLLTNASGGIRDDLAPGSLLAIDDHINTLPGNPLTGPYDPRLGARFPDQSAVYNAALRRTLDEAAADAGVALKHGVYLAAPGPCYETPAEVEAYRRLGADAVGMSTVPEAVVGSAIGRRVAAVSCIANRAAGAAERELSHKDVIAAVDRSRPSMAALVAAFLERVTA